MTLSCGCWTSWSPSPSSGTFTPWSSPRTMQTSGSFTRKLRRTSGMFLWLIQVKELKLKIEILESYRYSLNPSFYVLLFSNIYHSFLFLLLIKGLCLRCLFLHICLKSKFSLWVSIYSNEISNFICMGYPTFSYGHHVLLIIS